MWPLKLSACSSTPLRVNHIPCAKQSFLRISIFRQTKQAIKGGGEKKKKRRKPPINTDKVFAFILVYQITHILFLGGKKNKKPSVEKSD